MNRDRVPVPVAVLPPCSTRLGRLLGALLCLGWLVACGHGTGDSAFELRRAPGRVKHDVPLDQIVTAIRGRPPRDAIRALESPEFVPVGEAVHLRDADRVLELDVGGDARAYPLYLLDGHEVVNDTVGGQALVVTWCPLCGAGVVFDRRVDGVLHRFGVSGYLWRSDLLLYDRATESFWSQIDARCVAGPLTGARLEVLPSRIVTGAAFAARHPAGRVLLTGGREGKPPDAYRQDRYARYRASEGLFGGLAFEDARVGAKEEVVGVAVGAKAHAWSLAFLRSPRAMPGTPARGPATDEVVLDAGTRWRVQFWPDEDRVEVFDAATGARVPSLRCYGFAWCFFHPGTGLTAETPVR